MESNETVFWLLLLLYQSLLKTILIMDVFPFLLISSFKISIERHRISSLKSRRPGFFHWTLTSIQHYPHFVFQCFFHTIFVWIYEYEMLISFYSLFHFFEHRATQSIVSSSNLLCLPDIISYFLFKSIVSFSFYREWY